VGDIGVRLSQLGYDALDTDDRNLIYSSSWPLLKLHMSGTATIADTSVEQKIIDHNLGYPPVFVWGSINNGNSIVTGASGDYAEMFGPPTLFSVNSTSLYYDGFYGGVSTQIFYRIYRYDLTTNFTATDNFTGSSIQNSLQSDYTFRISKDGKSINSTDMRDFVIHSDARSPMVHMSVSGNLVPTTDGVAGYEVKATHNLNYVPFFLCYYIDPTTGRYVRTPTGTGGATGAFVSNKTVKFGAAASSYANGASVIVFKDPFDLTLTAQVVV